MANIHSLTTMHIKAMLLTGDGQGGFESGGYVFVRNPTPDPFPRFLTETPELAYVDAWKRTARMKALVEEPRIQRTERAKRKRKAKLAKASRKRNRKGR